MINSRWLLSYIALLLQRICQIAVSVREVRLQFNGTAISVDGEINKSLLIIDAGQVSMDNGVIRAEAQGSEISSHSPAHVRLENVI